MSHYNEPKLPPDKQFRKLSRKELRKLIHDFVEFAERGAADERGGGVALAIVRAQYVRDELARRDQDRQTRRMLVMTGVITVMTAVIMIATVCPECPKQWAQSAVHWMLNWIGVEGEATYHIMG
jgi:hypothetical protein